TNMNEPDYENLSLDIQCATISTSSEIEFNTNECNKENTYTSVPYTLTSSDVYSYESNTNKYNYEKTQYTLNLRASTSFENHVFCESNDHNQDNAPNAWSNHVSQENTYTFRTL
ncbi:10099_t:CDS:2, partial [Gigaspora margarita]